MAGRNSNRNNNNNNNDKPKPPPADLFALIPQFDKDGNKLKEPAFVPLAAMWETRGENNNLVGTVQALPIALNNGEPMRVLLQWRGSNG